MPKPEQEVLETIVIETQPNRCPLRIGFSKLIPDEILYVDAEMSAYLGVDNVPLIRLEPPQEEAVWWVNLPDAAEMSDLDVDSEEIAAKKAEASKRLGQITIASISGGETVDIEDGTVYQVIPPHLTAIPFVQREPGSDPKAGLRVYEMHELTKTFEIHES